MSSKNDIRCGVCGRQNTARRNFCTAFHLCVNELQTYGAAFPRGDGCARFTEAFTKESPDEDVNAHACFLITLQWWVTSPFIKQSKWRVWTYWILPLCMVREAELPLSHYMDYTANQPNCQRVWEHQCKPVSPAGIIAVQYSSSQWKNLKQMEKSLTN